MIKKITFIVLYPLSVLYNLVTSIRNLLFDVKVFKAFQSQTFAIGVGNLTVGGTGKTPVIDFLIGLLKSHQVAVLSRGYGRKTRGFIQITEASGPAEVGDEPKMLFDRHWNNAKFFVGEERAPAVKNITDLYPETRLLLLDDVYQHRYFKPQLMILLCDYNRPFYKDYLLPAGRLRESRSGAERADIILVTKCPIFSNNSEKRQIEKEIRKYSDPEARIYFSSFISGTPLNTKGKTLQTHQKVVLISGLAQNQNFYNTVSTSYTIEKHFAFPDHYSYTAADIEKVQTQYPQAPIITTEKDLVKIKATRSGSLPDSLYFVPLTLAIEEEEAFVSDLLTSFMRYAGN